MMCPGFVLVLERQIEIYFVLWLTHFCWCCHRLFFACLDKFSTDIAEFVSWMHTASATNASVIMTFRTRTASRKLISWDYLPCIYIARTFYKLLKLFKILEILETSRTQCQICLECNGNCFVSKHRCHSQKIKISKE